MKIGILTGLSYLVLSLALLKAAPKQETKLLEKLTTTKLANYQLKDDQSLTTAIKRISTSLKLENNKTDLAKTLETTKIPAALITKKIAKLGLGKVSIAEILDILCNRAGVAWTVKNEKVVFTTIDLKKKANFNHLDIKTLQTTIEKGEFTKEITLRQVLNFLRQRSRELAKSDTEEQKRGMSFVVTRRSVKQSNEELEEDDDVVEELPHAKPVGELSFIHLKIIEILHLACKRSEMQLSIINHTIVISELEK